MIVVLNGCMLLIAVMLAIWLAILVFDWLLKTSFDIFNICPRCGSHSSYVYRILRCARTEERTKTAYFAFDEKTRQCIGCGHSRLVKRYGCTVRVRRRNTRRR